MTIGQATSFGVLSWLAIAPTLRGQAASVLTWHNDNARTGQNLQETILTPANVNFSSFGKLFAIAVDGKVDAQPLYVSSVTIPAQGLHNVLYVVTEHDSAYAFDADNGGPLWHVSLLGSGETPSDDHGCSQVTPEIGATATPAIDPQVGTHGTIYVVATSKDSSNKYHHRVHALDLTTGAEQFGGPVEVQATYAGSGVENTFNPTVHKERPGLLLLNGVVYTSWSSHCDSPSYAGWVIGYNETTLQQVSALNLVPNGNDAGLWNAGAGPAADASGNIYALTGNGTFDTTLNSSGFPNNSDYGNAFVKLSTTGGPLRVVDYFTMSNTTSESNGDVDLGSGGALLLPPLVDSLGHSRDLAVGAGKDKHIYVVDRTNLGKYNSGGNLIYQDMPNALPGGVWSSPAWFNGKLYYGDVGGTLKAFAFANGLFQTPPASHSTNSFGYPGTTPSISANGTSNGIVWAVENAGTAVLHAYDAGDLSKELYNSNQAASGRDHFGAGNKFIAPTIANGKVYVGTTNGVGVLGLIGQPSAVSVTPNSGAGPTQTFSAVYTDPNGASDLGVVYLDFATSAGATNSCFVAYVPSGNALYLLKDTSTGTVPGSITPGGSGTLSNSQCTLSGSGGSVTMAGNNLTVPFNITFAGGFTGLKNIYGLAQKSNGSQGGWQTLGSWTPSSAAPLSAVSVSPNSGSGLTGTFSAVYTDPNGASDLQAVYLDFGSVGFAAHNCIVVYVPGPNALYLFNDDNSGALGPITEGAGGGSVQNSQCKLSSGSTAATLSGNNLTVPFTIQFLAGYGGKKTIFGLAQSYNGTQSGGGVPQSLGAWEPATSTPAAVSVSPNSGSGLSQVFTAAYSDTGGANDLQVVYLTFGSALNAANSCAVGYSPGNNQLFLFNDPATATATLGLGGGGSVSNSQCTLSGGGTAASMAGTGLTVPFSITFKSGFTGAKTIFGLAQTYDGTPSAVTTLGSWTP
jgi:hypothetical protein